MPRREITPAHGLYKNGARWWIRTVRSPLTGEQKSLSTGSKDVARANAVLAFVRSAEENPTQYEWLKLAVAGDVSLDQLYTHHAAGTLHTLKQQLTAKSDAEADTDLDPFVAEWVTKHLTALGIRENTRTTYERQVRFFIPEGEAFPKSRLTEDWIKEKVGTLTGSRLDRSALVGGSTRRRYLVALQLFIRYARKRVPLDNDPLLDADWIPKNGSPRSQFHEHETVKTILTHLDAEHARAVSLFYGSGIELGAFLAMKAKHVGATLPDGRGTVIAPGSKNEHREERTIFVDAWAWPAVKAQAKNKTPLASLWSYNPANGGRELREAFYWAQVKAGLVEEPVCDEKTRKYLWGAVHPHTLHDCRHSYCINRSLGLDGEAPQDVTFLAAQLGHADEQMVLTIYKKANVKERLRLIQQQQVVKAARAAGGK